jgi:hypothetical protein
MSGRTEDCHLVRRAKGGIEHLQELDVPAVDQDLDVRLEDPILEEQAGEDRAYHLVKGGQEPSHTVSLDVHRGLSGRFSNLSEKRYTCHRKACCRAAVLPCCC